MGFIQNRWLAALPLAVVLLGACGQAVDAPAPAQTSEPISTLASKPTLMPSSRPTSTQTSPATPALGASTPAVSTKASPTLAPLMSAVVLHQLAAPHRDYTLAVPSGWAFAPDPSGGGRTHSENPIIVSPAGQSLPSAFVWGLLPITDFVELGCQPDFSTQLRDPAFMQKLSQCWGSSMAHKWTPQEAVPIIGNALKYLFPGSQFSVLEQGPIQADGHADARIRFTTPQTGPVDQQWSVTMVYALDAAYTALGYYHTGKITPLYHTFAFLNGCGAAPGTLDQHSRTCAAVLRSFHPTSWLSSDIQRYLAGQQRQVSAFNGTLDRIGKQNYQQQMARSAADQRIARGWWNALGNTADLTDGQGTLYNVEAGHDRYCAYLDFRVRAIDNKLVALPNGCTQLHQGGVAVQGERARW